MTTAYDVPASCLIEKLEQSLKEKNILNPPEWKDFVKTGIHKELPPTSEDWWFTRGAAILRSIYLHGPIGTERLSSIYGGKQDRGSKPYKKVKGSGSIIRKILQQLEKAGYVESTKNGRKISSSGQSLIDNISYKIKNEINEKNKKG